MSEDKKTIQEALAEVQRNVNEASASMPKITVSGRKQTTSGAPKPAANQNVPNANPPSSSGVETAANIGAVASSLPKRVLGSAAVGAAASELGKEVAFGSEKARQFGHDLYKNPIIGGASDLMLKAREALGIPSTAPKQYQRDSSSLEKPNAGVSPAPKPNAGVSPAPKPNAGVSPAPKPNAGVSPAPKADDSFAATFKRARDTAGSSTGQFSWHGKDYQTNIKGSGTAEKPQEKYVAPSAQSKTGIDVPKPTETKPASTEDGKKKKMSEETNPLIASFLALQAKNASNMFVEAKKLSKKQKEKMDVDDDNDIDADDLTKLRSKKVEEESADYLGSSTVTKEKKGYVDPSTPTEPYKKAPMSTAAGDVLSKAKNALDKTGVKEENESLFSEAELEHINSFFLEASVAPTRPEVAAEARPDKVNDGVSQNDVTGTAESGKRKVKEEVELDEGGMPPSVIASKKKYAEMSDKDFAEKHGHKSEKELRDMAARHGYGFDKATKTGSDHYLKRVAAANKTNEEVIQEGRPKKNPTPETTERDPRKHIQVEAGRAAAGSVVDFHHNDGTKSKITPAMGRRITSHLNSLKPAERQSAVNKMHDSAEGLKV